MTNTRRTTVSSRSKRGAHRADASQSIRHRPVIEQLLPGTPQSDEIPAALPANDQTIDPLVGGTYAQGSRNCGLDPPSKPEPEPAQSDVPNHLIEAFITWFTADPEFQIAASTVMRVVRFLAIAGSALAIWFFVKVLEWIGVPRSITWVLTFAEHGLVYVDLVVLLKILIIDLNSTLRDISTETTWTWRTGLITALILVSAAISCIETSPQSIMPQVKAYFQHTLSSGSAFPGSSAPTHPITCYAPNNLGA
jgi:hypothetical protein